MKTTKRFENAVTKLYNAFHKGELDAMDCKHCAVGNICDNSSLWSFVITTNADSDSNHINGMFTQIIRLTNMFQMTSEVIEKTEYSVMELAKIERVFLEQNTIKQNKETQFKGLEAVVKYLCELDNIPNVMDYSSLFEFNEKNEPIKELSF